MNVQKEKITVKEYKNGLRLVHVHLPNWTATAFTVGILVGSYHETNKEYGLAHFTEHMMFGSTHKSSKDELSTRLKMLGAIEDGSTSLTSTKYSYKSLTRNFPDVVKIASERLYFAKLDKAEFEIQRKVILEELARTKNSYNVDDVIYKKEDRRNEGNIGPKTNLKNYKIEDIDAFIKKHYNAKNTVISVVGDVSFKDAEKLINEYFVQPASTEGVRNEIRNTWQIKAPNMICQNVDLSPTTSFSAYFRYRSEDNLRSLAKIAILKNILNGNDGKLFRKLRDEKGLVYETYSKFMSKINKDCINEIYFKSQNENLEAGVIASTEVINDLKSRKLTKEELNRAVAASLMLLEPMTATTDRSDLYCSGIMRGAPVYTDSELYEEMQKVTEEDIYRFVNKIWTKDNLYILQTGPIPNKDMLELFQNKIENFKSAQDKANVPVQLSMF